MARFTIRDIEPLELEFKDGSVKHVVFNNEAFILYTEEFGDIMKDMSQEMDDKPFDFATKILYCGLKITEPKTDYKEAQSLMLKGGWGLLIEVFLLLIDNFKSITNEETKKKFMDSMNVKIKQMNLDKDTETIMRQLLK